MAVAKAMARNSTLDDASEDTRDAPSYGRILKSSALIGAASLVNIGIGMVRTKAMALLLGPSGVGLLGLYSAIFDLAQSIAGMGIVSSGVRQIAEAAGSGETARIAHTAAVLRRTTWFLGVFGAVLLAALAVPVSRLSFGDADHAGAIALLALAVLCRVVSDGQGALIQGLRRIGDLAKLGMLAALYSTLIGVPIVYALGEAGVVPSLVAVALASFATSCWYSRKVRFPAVQFKALQLRREQMALLRLGFAFMASGLMMMGTAYLIRILLLRQFGPAAAGLYQAAWTLGGLYVGLVLQAMGADFYPRLTAVAQDDPQCNRLVNEQAHVSLLLAGPGAIATLALAPWVLHLFYAAEFQGAVEVLRWLCLGMMLRIVSWPMGFIILAKGAQGWFFWSETLWTLVYLALAWLGVERHGLAGAGMAFALAYVFHCLMVYAIARRLSGFAWSAANVRANLLYLPLIAVVFGGCYGLPGEAALAVGLAATAWGGAYSLRSLTTLVPPDRLPRRFRPILGGLDALSVRRAPAQVAKTPAFLAKLGFALMIATVFGMWVHWYGRNYDWTQDEAWPILELPIRWQSAIKDEYYG